MPSTPDSTSDSPFFRRVADYFVMRRGRGVSISSADCDLLLRWEREGISWLGAMEGIDRAFQRLSRTPASLRQCARFVEESAATFSDELLDPNILADVFGNAKAHAADEGTNAPLAAQTPEAPAATLHDEGVERVCQRLLKLAADHRAHHQAADAYRALHDELRELEEEREEIGPETLALLNEAFAIQVMDRLSPERRSELDRRLEQAPRHNRVATLIGWVHNEEGLALPLPPNRPLDSL